MVLPGITSKVVDAQAGVPEPVWELVAAQSRANWSGTISLNMKNGRIIAYELTEKTRLDQH